MIHSGPKQAGTVPGQAGGRLTVMLLQPLRRRAAAAAVRRQQRAAHGRHAVGPQAGVVEVEGAEALPRLRPDEHSVSASSGSARSAKPDRNCATCSGRAASSSGIQYGTQGWLRDGYVLRVAAAARAAGVGGGGRGGCGGVGRGGFGGGAAPTRGEVEQDDLMYCSRSVEKPGTSGLNWRPSAAARSSITASTGDGLGEYDCCSRLVKPLIPTPNGLTPRTGTKLATTPPPPPPPPPLPLPLLAATAAAPSYGGAPAPPSSGELPSTSRRCAASVGQAGTTAPSGQSSGSQSTSLPLSRSSTNVEPGSRTGHPESRRGRRLVVSHIATVVNYEYAFYW
ncbi:hypothetical protein TSOC_007756 [Tetrabaena socialis]|uniref:Uncharacterized protein n=1 Tax=Tetrabaena socialis TaxID=47790 RepID=A0A2J8A092_9CHLO|nr:hypothetical protein TSOC_007756 [Tetrabaena socialis]|eukprot:PNH05942.1 hypothetical protein TSOC_007756 [Tetrabaena socialis]